MRHCAILGLLAISAVTATGQNSQRDSAELAVLREVRRYVFNGHAVPVVSAHARTNLCDPQPLATCFADTSVTRYYVPVTTGDTISFSAAVADFDANKSANGMLPAHLLAALNVDTSSAVVGPPTRCNTPHEFGITRVGFDVGLTYAVAGFYMSVGPLTPGCGSFNGTTFLLRRTRTGTWEVIGGVRGPRV